MTDNEDDTADVIDEIINTTTVKKTRKKAATKPIIDNEDPIDRINIEDVIVYMNSGYSYSGPGVHFTREAPFQRMPALEAERLMRANPRRFSLATREQIQQFYSLG